MKQAAVQCNTQRRVCGWIVLVGLLLWGVTAVGPVDVYATTIYSYIDEQGNPRFSDSMDNIPEKYRAKVKTHEQAAPQERPLSPLENVKMAVAASATSVKEKVGELLQGAGVSLPSVPVKSGAVASSPGMNTSQSQILNFAGAAAIVLLLMMYFSKSQLMRLLGLCLLIGLGIATPVLLYVSEDGALTAMKGKAMAAGQAQQDRVKQIVP